MRKVELVKVFQAATPEELEADYKAWMTHKCVERETNVAVSSVPFYTDVIERSLMPGPKNVVLAVFYHDYLLQAYETGGPKHHAMEGEGISAVGPDHAPRRGKPRAGRDKR